MPVRLDIQDILGLVVRTDPEIGVVLKRQTDETGYGVEDFDRMSFSKMWNRCAKKKIGVPLSCVLPDKKPGVHRKSLKRPRRQKRTRPHCHLKPRSRRAN